MKLKNKQTGEIIEAESCNNTGGCISIYYEEKDGQIGTKDCYSSLAELNAEWEDAPEEPKGKWFISNNGQIHNDEGHERFREERKLIGNYFDTREEAEKAVEKLKAVKRLKDKGIVIRKLRHNENGGDMYWSCPSKTGISDKQIWLDLDLLFGGEE